MLSRNNFANNSAAVLTPAGTRVTVPADTLASGSVLRVRFAANMKQAAAQSVSFLWTLGGTTLIIASGINFANGTALAVDTSITIRASGANVPASISVVGASSAGSIVAQAALATNVNTAVDNDLLFAVAFSGAANGTNLDINQYELVLFP